MRLSPRLIVSHRSACLPPMAILSRLRLNWLVFWLLSKTLFRKGVSSSENYYCDLCLGRDAALDTQGCLGCSHQRSDTCRCLPPWMKGKTMNTPRDLAMSLVDPNAATYTFSERQMLQACLAYMSWDDVIDMLKENQMLEQFTAADLADHQIYPTS